MRALILIETLMEKVWNVICDTITGAVTLIAIGVDYGLRGLLDSVDWSWDAFFPTWTNPPTWLRYTLFPLLLFWVVSQFILMMIRLLS